MTTLEATTAQIALASLATAPAPGAMRLRIVPWLTLTVLLLLIACAIAQERHPELLAAAGRNSAAAASEGWRLFTSLWFQDGGVAGGLLNLVMLAAIGWRAEATLRWHGWIMAYLAGGIAGGLAGLAWQPEGAGNSIATLGLAGALLAIKARQGGVRALPWALSGLAIGALLTVSRDIHGVAVIAGAAMGFIFDPSPASVRPKSDP